LYLGSALSHGATLVTLPRFEISMFLRAIQEFQVTRLYAVPPILLAIVNARETFDYNLSSLRHIVCGAAPLDERLATATVNRLNCTLVQGYGLTETSPMTHFGRSRGKFAEKIGSVGVCAPNTEAKVIDCETGLDLGVRQRGELVVRGPQVMQGYLARPDETAATIDGDGWLHTGDVAYFDEDGDFFVVDRVKELIKYKGLQVAPAELEALMLTHPDVLDAAVIPRPDVEAGEVPVAYVVAHKPLDAEEIMTFVASRVAPYKRIRRVEFVAEIPKSPSGKILRRVLVERERARC
jgi:acyl-CoA synthetase (AMP-forming)/AMP-acid ligase II